MPVTTRSTSGSGFSFEDQIAAFLLTKMLSGDALPSLGDHALGTVLHSQTRALGWSIDDLLAISDAIDGTRRQLAISCKSSMQVTVTGLPDAFVLAAWDQWKRSSPKGVYDRINDKLMLVTRGRHQAFEPLWADVKGWSSEPENPLALARSKATAAHSKIIGNIKSAIQTVDGNVSDEDVIALVSRLEVMATDFDLPNSEHRTSAINQCRRLLRRSPRT